LEKSLKEQENSTNYIQYAKELWASIVFLSSTILKKAKSALNSKKILTSNILVNAITSIYLLENTSLKHIFNDFLQTRTVIDK